MSNRLFSSTFNDGKAHADFTYIYDANAVISGNNPPISGAWRPAIPTDFAASVSVSGLSLTVGSVAVTGNPQVTISNPILAVSGNFGAGGGGGGLVTGAGGFFGITGTPNVNITNGILPVSGVLTATIGNVAVTGGNIATSNTNEIAALSSGNAFLAAISGSLTSNLNAPVYVTGIVQTIVTGTVSSSITNPIGVTGTSVDLNSVYTGIGIVPYNFLAVGGRAVNVTGLGTLAAYTTGNSVEFAFNANNAGLLVNQGCLQANQDYVTAITNNTGTATVAPATSGISNAGFGIALPNNPVRVAWGVTNLSTGALLVSFGSTIPTTGSFNVILSAATSLIAGNGGSFIDSPAVWTGPVSITGLSINSPAYTAWQI